MLCAGHVFFFLLKKWTKFAKHYGKIKKNMKTILRGYRIEPYCKSRQGSLRGDPAGIEPAKKQD